MADEPTMPDPPTTDLPADTPQPPHGTGRGRLVALVAVGVVVVAVAAFLVGRSTSESTSTSPTTAESTSAPTTSTTTSRPTTTTTTPPTSVPASDAAVWPTAASGISYADPTAAARGFATDFVGFTNPVVGTFRAGDSRSGEVDVQATATGPITTVLVRQLVGTSWSVIGASTPNITVDAPAASATITSPVRVTGKSTAFEATVNVEVREDSQKAPIGSGFVMGGSMGELAPFEGTIEFTASSSQGGALVFVTHSAMDGSITEATVVRVQLHP